MQIRAYMLSAVFFAFFSLLRATYAFSEDPSSTGNISVLPYSIFPERSIDKELSSPRYTLSAKQQRVEDIAALTSFALIDYSQTVSMLYGSSGYQELNPILGTNPRIGDVIAFGIIGVGLFSVLAMTLPDSWKQIFVDSVMSTEGLNIADNRQVYQGWNTDGPPIRGRSFNGIPIIISIRL